MEVGGPYNHCKSGLICPRFFVSMSVVSQVCCVQFCCVRGVLYPRSIVSQVTICPTRPLFFRSAVSCVCCVPRHLRRRSVLSQVCCVPCQLCSRPVDPASVVSKVCCIPSKLCPRSVVAHFNCVPSLLIPG